MKETFYNFFILFDFFRNMKGNSLVLFEKYLNKNDLYKKNKKIYGN